MPSWNEILSEAGITGSTFDVVRRKYLKTLFDFTGRNVIAYYSGWLQKANVPNLELNETDKNGFMAVMHKLDRAKGLDLILHTPGGDIAAAESLVFYLRQMFGTDIRAIVPQIAMSAGTMIALAANEIVMGKHSSLGPIDPQFGGLSAHAIVEEFKRAHSDFKRDNSMGFVWQPILSQYGPTIVGECEKAIAWANEMVTKWLETNMFKDDPNKTTKIKNVITELGDHALTKAHNRRISVEKIKELGLNVIALEDNQEFQEAVMSVHHICMLTLERTSTSKLIENHNGTAFIVSPAQVIQIQ